jgi:hypothetical protein
MTFSDQGEIVCRADYYDALSSSKQLGWAAIFWMTAA